MKRILDVVLSLIGLLVLSPVFILLCLIIRTKLGSPVFFTQIRPGLNGKTFNMIKFRSMTNERDNQGKLLPNDIRLTKFGKLLRSTSLDELPELFNVLKGDMSLVGPRPLRVEYLPLYSKRQIRRHAVKPGITGWAQINGRNAIDWETKFEYDVWYVENQSIKLDFRILLLTITKVLVRDGINDAQGEFVKPFEGAKLNE